MKSTKESSRPCPSCSAALPRGNWKTYVSKCLKCYRHICNSCNFADKCNDCFMLETNDAVSAEYFIEKYGTVKSA